MPVHVPGRFRLTPPLTVFGVAPVEWCHSMSFMRGNPRNGKKLAIGQFYIICLIHPERTLDYKYESIPGLTPVQRVEITADIFTILASPYGEDHLAIFKLPDPTVATTDLQTGIRYYPIRGDLYRLFPGVSIIFRSYQPGA